VKKVLPGPVTLLMDAPDEFIERSFVSRGLEPAVRDRIYRGNTVALRCPDQDMTRRILDAVGQPVVACAANVEGAKPARDAAEASRQLAGQVDYVVDAGVTRFAQPSTLVRLTDHNGAVGIEVQRSGVYDERLIRKLARWTVLIVCSGNTCRSPMAAALAADLLARQRGVPVDQLEAAGVRVVSAGTMAMDGLPASAEAVEVLSQGNIDLRRHRSRSLTAELIHQADVIYTMTRAHRQSVVNQVPAAEAKTFCLDESGDIADPVGLDVAAYQRTADRVRRLLEQRLTQEGG
jgi:protein-tyrosine phosphatase